MIIQRVKQFIHALHARMTVEDRGWVCSLLTREERLLFEAMTQADQCHSVRVAKTALALARNQSVHETLLLRCALLHDIGRQKGDMGTQGKILAVLMQAVFPYRSLQWARPGGRHWWEWPRRVLYIYYYHPDIGRDKLLALGCYQEALIIAQHHKAPAESDSPELCLLRAADAMN